MILITGQLLVSQEAPSPPLAPKFAMALTVQPVQVDEEQRPMNFSQVFQLQRDDGGNYFVYNDIFKLIFG